MNVLVVFNPIAGAGRAAAVASEAARTLNASGHQATTAPSVRGHAATWLDPLLGGCELLVIVGGDGAVRAACGSASRCGVPIYQVPSGTENLFAREMGMDRNPARLLGAIQRWRIEHIDLGEANGAPFVLMASMGFDARVVHDLAGRRNGSITHWSYLGPLVRQLAGWRAVSMAVSVDGERIDGGQPGFVVVANCRQYGWRLNPCRRACLTDGLLDTVFFPTRSRLDLVGWMVRCRRQTHLEDARVIYRTGRRVVIECEDPEPLQLDGDPFPGPGEGRPLRLARVEVTIRERALAVLMPAVITSESAENAPRPA